MRPMFYLTKIRLLQAAIVIAALVPIGGGLAGVVMGDPSTNPFDDSHHRYLSGLLLGIGLTFWYCAKHLHRCRQLFLHLCYIVMLAGGMRLLGAIVLNIFTLPIVLTLVMELLVTPLLCIATARFIPRSAMQAS